MGRRRVKKQRNSMDLTESELAMLRTTSKLSNKEINLWHKEFLRKYPSGTLDKETFLKTYQELYPKNDTYYSFETLFNIIDVNHDNVIDFNEFLFLAAIGNQTGSLEERLEIAFELWDTSSDGLLDVNELGYLISAMYDRLGIKDRQGDLEPHRRAKAIINQLDITGDKKLNKDEFINGCKNDPVLKDLLAPDS